METLLTFVSTPSQCEYLPDRQWQLQYDVVRALTAAEYDERLRQGWRRFGYATFRPNESQRRAWKANASDVSITIGAPAVTRDALALFEKFHQHRHERLGWPPAEPEQITTFIKNPFRTEEWAYSIAGRLVAVSYVDRVPDGLSAIYCFHDPDEGKRSLGTFNVLSMIADAREHGLRHVYLGYYVEGCRSLEYKARFRPNEIFDHGQWTAAPQLNRPTSE